MNHEELAQSFHQLLRPFPKSDRFAETLASEVFSRYNESHRHYHTLDHVSALLELIDEYKDYLRFPELLQLAAWYHDVIYDPSSSDNEAASAAFAAEHLGRLGAEPALIKRIEKLIRSTASHELINDDDSDAAFFLDFDLAVLADESFVYDRYTEQIRSEYSRYPDLLYKPGRRKVLRHFLGKEFIYHTAMLRDKWEEQARKNIENELRKLG